MNKFQRRVNQVKEHLRGMATLNENIENISEKELKKDAKDITKAILKDNPNWLNEKW